MRIANDQMIRVICDDLDEFVYRVCGVCVSVGLLCERPICFGVCVSILQAIHTYSSNYICFTLCEPTNTQNKTSSNSQACDRKSEALNSLWRMNDSNKKNHTPNLPEKTTADSIRFFIRANLNATSLCLIDFSRSHRNTCCYCYCCVLLFFLRMHCRQTPLGKTFNRLSVYVFFLGDRWLYYADDLRLK